MTAICGRLNAHRGAIADPRTARRGRGGQFVTMHVAKFDAETRGGGCGDSDPGTVLMVLGSLAVVPRERHHPLVGAVPREEARVLGDLSLHLAAARPQGRSAA
jgi:hypothetical protein